MCRNISAFKCLLGKIREIITNEEKSTEQCKEEGEWRNMGKRHGITWTRRDCRHEHWLPKQESTWHISILSRSAIHCLRAHPFSFLKKWQAEASLFQLLALRRFAESQPSDQVQMESRFFPQLMGLQALLLQGWNLWTFHCSSHPWEAHQLQKLHCS